MDCSDVLKQGTKQLGVGVDAAAFLESTLDEISSICSNEANPIAPWANTSLEGAATERSGGSCDGLLRRR